MHNKLVLVVEDDEPIRLLLTELLQTAGLRVATLPSGERVLDVARELLPAAIVLDIGLPGQHGLSVLDELKAQPDLAGVPVVVVSAWCDSELVNRAMASGAVDYVRKPFAGDDLVRRVKAAALLLAGPQPQEMTDDVRRVMHEDRLTGLPNRLGLEPRFEERLETCQATGVPLSLVMVRVDAFDEIARWGDASATDLLVRMLANDVARRIRPGDAIGRIAEDTLLVIAPRCDLAAAGKLAELLRGGAATVHARAGWTVSAGYASTSACAADELLSCCDLALTLAREAGGDLSRPGVGFAQPAGVPAAAA